MSGVDDAAQVGPVGGADRHGRRRARHLRFALAGGCRPRGGDGRQGLSRRVRQGDADPRPGTGARSARGRDLPRRHAPRWRPAAGQWWAGAERRRARQDGRPGAGACIRGLARHRLAWRVLPWRHRLACGGQREERFANVFAEHRIPTEGAEMSVRTGGSGPPLLLPHGYPQTHVRWHKIAAELAGCVTLVLADLRGASSAPPGDAEHKTYSKRAMAADCLAVMRALGHQRFMMGGHDRGGRVAHRLAADHPDAIWALIAIDILPTAEVWRRIMPERALSGYHWAFLAQPFPLPETLIGREPTYYLEHTLQSWAGPGGLSPF